MIDTFNKFFLTGGAGNIGSHTRVGLLNAVVDMTLSYNFLKSQLFVLAFVAQITGKKPTLAQCQMKALQRLSQTAERYAINLSTGIGYRVLNMVRAFEQASGNPVPYRFGPRMAGDIAACYADLSLALALLGWRTERSLDPICLDALRWQNQNPQGSAGA